MTHLIAILDVDEPQKLGNLYIAGPSLPEPQELGNRRPVLRSPVPMKVASMTAHLNWLYELRSRKLRPAAVTLLCCWLAAEPLVGKWA
jgi:hypothetical protein